MQPALPIPVETWAPPLKQVLDDKYRDKVNS